jgi:hypothetical protein
MDFADLITKFGLPLAGLIVVTLGFITGKVVPRFIYDQERAQRLESERRFDRSMDLSEAILEELRRSKTA